MRCVLLACLCACSFSPGRAAQSNGDASGEGVADAAPDAIPDAAPCMTPGATCVGDTLRTCTTVGQAPTEDNCTWGCDSTGTPRCLQVAPSGGWEMQATGDTTGFTGLQPSTLPDNAIVDTTTGTISDGGVGVFRTGMGPNNGIDFQVRAIGTTGKSVGVFRARSFTITNLSLIGTNAIAFVADDGITIGGVINAVPLCLYIDVRTPGPGGFAGGLNNVEGLPAPPGGGGAHGTGNDEGGGGGGFGGAGGDGGNLAASGGALRGDAMISLLLGGSGGGGGDSHSNSGRGGGGGAAIHLISNGPITMTSGGINAGACGGRSGLGTNDGGGGGGAGGAILIEAPTVSITGTLAANGGGGGGGNTGNSNLTVGQKGQLSRTPAMGAPAGDGSPGGAGGAGTTPQGATGSTGSGGGGGGGVGRIRINTRLGVATVTNAILSPGPGDPGTAYSEGQAATR